MLVPGAYSDQIPGISAGFSEVAGFPVYSSERMLGVKLASSFFFFF